VEDFSGVGAHCARVICRSNSREAEETVVRGQDIRIDWWRQVGFMEFIEFIEFIEFVETGDS